jgi:hypothetical protein
VALLLRKRGLLPIEIGEPLLLGKNLSFIDLKGAHSIASLVYMDLAPGDCGAV